MDKQAVFDKVTKHLLTQNAKSCNDRSVCLYRSDSGLKCAIGCLIPDHISVPNYGTGLDGECGIDVLALCRNFPEIKEILDIQDQSDLYFYRELQRVHDYYDVCQWSSVLQDFAKRHNLTYTG